MERRKLRYRYFVNENYQIEGVDLVEEKENPDGVLTIAQIKKVSPKKPGSIRPFGATTRLPDKYVTVKLCPTGEIISEDPSLTNIDVIMDIWDDYGPLIEDTEGDE